MRVAADQCNRRREAISFRGDYIDMATFGQLYDHYLPGLYRYLRARTTNDDDAADLTQLVFVKALESLPRYRSRGLPFGAWLFRIARNAAIDAHRQRRATVSLQVLPEILHPAVWPNVEDAVLQQEVRLQVSQILELLRPDAREVLLLRFVAGLSLREIAPVVGKSESGVHRQIVRTLQFIKERYHDFE